MRPASGSPDLGRYSRQLVLAQVGVRGQAVLARSRVLVVGAGGLGSPALLYLAAAGVGTVGVVDDDVVETANLHRQVVHATEAVGRPKTASAAESIRRVNPATLVVEHRRRLRPDNAVDIMRGYDVVIDGSDTFATRYAVSDACVSLGLAQVWGSVLGFQGQASVWLAGSGPCYRCVFPERSVPVTGASCEQAGVFGPVCAAVGSVQATEALKLLLGVGEPLVGRLLVHDALAQSWDTLPVRADPDCPSCGTHRRPVADHGLHAPAEALDAGAPGDVAAWEAPVPVVEPSDLAGYLANTGAVLLQVRGAVDGEVGAIPGSVPVGLEQFQSGAAFALPELADPHRPVVLYCLTGSRSEQAARLGRRAGYALMSSLRGGVLEWRRVAAADPHGS
ncbi:MAG: ThiF family adenylyltransferase [Dermatophilaceae bacterium]